MYAGTHITFILGSLSLALSYNPPYRETTVSINTKKWLHTVSDKFVSLTVDPEALIKSENYGKAAINMAKSLSPAYLRVGGPGSDHFSFQTKNEDLDYTSNTTISASEWVLLNELLEDAGLNLIICLNAITRLDGVWDSRNTLQLVSFSDRHGYNMDFELGYESQWTVLEGNSFPGAEMGRDVVRLRKILDAYPRYSQSMVIGPDLTRLTRSEDISFARNYLTEAGSSLAALTLHPRFSSSLKADEDASLEMLQMIAQLETNVWGKDVLARLSGKAPPRKPIWIAESKRRDGAPQFKDAINWVRRLGAAAKLGVQVMMAQPYPISFSDPTPDFWMMTLHKALVGRQVLDSKLVSGNRSMVEAYSHCTQTIHNPDTTILDDTLVKYEKGAVTLFGVNMADETLRLNLKVNIKEEEIHKYILSEGKEPSTGKRITLFNNQKLSLSPDGELPILTPKIRKPNRSLALTLPPKSIFFIVIPDIKARTCMLPLSAYLEDTAQAAQSKTAAAEEVFEENSGGDKMPASEESTDSNEVFVSFRSPMFADKSLSKLFTHKDKYGKTTKKANDPLNDGAEPVVKYITFSDNNWLSDFPKKMDFEAPKEEDDSSLTVNIPPSSYSSYAPIEAETPTSRREKYKIFADAVFGRRNVTSGGDSYQETNAVGRSKVKRHIDSRKKEETVAKNDGAALLQEKHEPTSAFKSVKLGDSVSKVNQLLDEINKNKIHRMHKDRTHEKSNPLFVTLEDEEDESEEPVVMSANYRKTPNVANDVKSDNIKSQPLKNEKPGKLKNFELDLKHKIESGKIKEAMEVEHKRKPRSLSFQDEFFLKLLLDLDMFERMESNKNDLTQAAPRLKRELDVGSTLLNSLTKATEEIKSVYDEKKDNILKILREERGNNIMGLRNKRALSDEQKAKLESYLSEMREKLGAIRGENKGNEKSSKSKPEKVGYARGGAVQANVGHPQVGAMKENKVGYAKTAAVENKVGYARAGAPKNDKVANAKGVATENKVGYAKVGASKDNKFGYAVEGAPKEDKVGYARPIVTEDKVGHARVGTPKEDKVGIARGSETEDKVGHARETAFEDKVGHVIEPLKEDKVGHIRETAIEDKVGNARGAVAEEKLANTRLGPKEDKIAHARVGVAKEDQHGSEEIIVSPIKSHPGLENTLGEIGQLSREKIIESVKEKADHLIASMRKSENSQKSGTHENKSTNSEQKVGLSKKESTKSSNEGQVVGAHHHKPHVKRPKLRASNPMEGDKKGSEQTIGSEHEHEQKLSSEHKPNVGKEYEPKVGSDHEHKLGSQSAYKLGSEHEHTYGGEHEHKLESQYSEKLGSEHERKSGDVKTLVHDNVAEAIIPKTVAASKPEKQLAEHSKASSRVGDAHKAGKREKREINSFSRSFRYPFSEKSYADYADFMKTGYNGLGMERLNYDAPKTVERGPTYHTNFPTNMQQVYPGYFVRTEPSANKYTTYRSASADDALTSANKYTTHRFASAEGALNSISKTPPTSSLQSESEEISEEKENNFDTPKLTSNGNVDKVEQGKKAAKTVVVQVFDENGKKIVNEVYSSLHNYMYPTNYNKYLAHILNRPSSTADGDVLQRLDTASFADFPSSSVELTAEQTSSEELAAETGKSLQLLVNMMNKIMDGRTVDDLMEPDYSSEYSDYSEDSSERAEFSKESHYRENNAQLQAPQVFSSTTPQAEISISSTAGRLTTSSSPPEVSTTAIPSVVATKGATTEISTASPPCILTTTPSRSDILTLNPEVTSTTESSTTTILDTTESSMTTAYPTESTTEFFGTKQTSETTATTDAEIHQVTTPMTIPGLYQPMTTSRTPVIYLPYEDDAIRHMFRFKRALKWLKNNEISSKSEESTSAAGPEDDIETLTNEVTKTNTAYLREEKQKETAKKKDDPIFTLVLQQHYDKMISSAPKAPTTQKMAVTSSNDLESSFRQTANVIQKIDKKIKEQTEAHKNNATSVGPNVTSDEKTEEAYASFLTLLANQLTNLIGQIQNSFFYKQVAAMFQT